MLMRGLVKRLALKDYRYVYVVFAIAIGFGGDNILWTILDLVLKRMKATTEKTEETKKQTEDAKWMNPYHKL